LAIGHVAIGGLFATGGVAIAPVSLGGVSIGALCAGGLSFGLFALGGGAAGVIAFGGAAIGALAAWGGLAVSCSWAMGGHAIAPHANDAEATRFFASRWYLRSAIWLFWNRWVFAVLLLPPLAARTIAAWNRKRREQFGGSNTR
jgi:hypothetical protein